MVRSKFGRRFDSYYTVLLLNIAPKLGDPVVWRRCQRSSPERTEAFGERAEEFSGNAKGDISVFTKDDIGVRRRCQKRLLARDGRDEKGSLVNA